MEGRRIIAGKDVESKKNRLLLPSDFKATVAAYHRCLAAACEEWSPAMERWGILVRMRVGSAIVRTHVLWAQFGLHPCLHSYCL